jgi:lipopolysaccharide transport system ATP-binding protein
MEPIIEIKNLGKRYKISHEKGKYVALRDVLVNVFKNPFSFIKEKTKNLVGINTKEDYWALKGVNLEINRGEIVGIIGKNGAGKSTLLKILSQITPPTEGEVIIKGKVGSLLEVGTGFHPELTGRENIFLNGAILGMGKREIAEKFDKIVEFAGIDKFLDTPVKYYSSGMYVRLAFSVAAHMEPDILLVDEVLAVGDAEFQKKCLGKMEEITKDSKRTILFISHNLTAIQNLCDRTVVLNKGNVVFSGNTEEAINRYLSLHNNTNTEIKKTNDESKPATITSIALIDERGSNRAEFPIHEQFKIKVDFVCNTPLPNATLSTIFYPDDGSILLFSSEADISGKLSSYENGKYHTEITVPAFLFNIGRYTFNIILHNPNVAMYSEVKDIGFEIKNSNNPRSVVFQKNHPGKIAVPLEYQVSKIDN